MYNIGCHLNFIGKSRETFGHWSPGTEAMTANLANELSNSINTHYLSHYICLCIFLNSNDSHPGGVVSQGSLTVPPHQTTGRLDQGACKQFVNSKENEHCTCMSAVMRKIV